MKLPLLTLLKCKHNHCPGPRGPWAAVTGAWSSHDYVWAPWFIHSSGGLWTVISTSVWQLPVSLYKVTTQHHWQACHKLKYNATTHSRIQSSIPHSLHQLLSNLKPYILFLCIDNTDPECAVSSQNKKKVSTNSKNPYISEIRFSVNIWQSPTPAAPFTVAKLLVEACRALSLHMHNHMHTNTW